eukprot:COSAG06_NODE_842_length_11986_cov_54.409355_5_plen_129_part_00
MPREPHAPELVLWRASDDDTFVVLLLLRLLRLLLLRLLARVPRAVAPRALDLGLRQVGQDRRHNLQRGVLLPRGKWPLGEEVDAVRSLDRAVAEPFRNHKKHQKQTSRFVLQRFLVFVLSLSWQDYIM